ncbi:methyl-accepting chemotaxis protein [Paenibacillus taihuensis]|uniref:Methyl-accepting chemotaxis protein n=1 Tax=Paenibacillus taihuensis TaxID=1156355 RepID=A0A3D9Q3P8_9BACL|nr:methyl-accepting chemotaxis protein [Paenibacillus taihuensis]REE55353.1 methyl-accepting chemotaxis protein [Paenibacillus taihuensis]
MKVSYFRSLAFRISLLAGICCLVLCSVLTYVSYKQQTNQVYDELNAVEGMFHSPLMLQTDEIEFSKAESLKNPEAYKSESKVMVLQAQMDRAASSDLVENAYMFYPEWKTQDGQPALLNFLSNSELYEGGEIPSTVYVPQPALYRALKDAEVSGYSVTKPYTDDYGTWISAISAVKDKNGKLIAFAGLDFNYKLIQTILNKRLMESIITGAVALLIFIILLSISVRYSLRGIKSLNKLAEHAAEGDLSGQTKIKSRNEIGLLSEHFNAMIRNLRSLIEHIAESSQQVSGASEKLLKGAAETVQATQAIAVSMEQLTCRSEEQLVGAQENSRAMDEITTGIQRIAESATETSRESEDAKQWTSEGNEQMQQNLSQIAGALGELRLGVQSMNSLMKLSEEIGNITKMISEVTTRTNLLALNASIEASRAGEHGRGFAVVSREIRTLAEQSKQSSEQIADLIERVQQETQAVFVAMDRGMVEFEAIETVVQKADLTFQQLAVTVQAVAVQMVDVSAVSQQMSAGSEEVSASIAEMASQSRMTSEMTKNISAASESQLATMSEVTETATRLSGLSGELQQAVAKFKL